MHYNIIDLLGNVGVAFIIVTYLLLQLNRMDSKSILYSLLNALGALFVIISLIQNFNISAFIIEGFWLIISLIGLVRFFIKK
ncbi:hypothetical protein BMS3Abin04_00919 [bacterium BMS3Abin04]|nr:hypothetical protein BMS3Abin04_00919 [bacterium BMS3Abin04]